MEINVFDWDESVFNLQRTQVYVFSDSVLCLGKIFETPQSNDAWEDRFGLLKTSPVYRNFHRFDGEPLEFEWNIFPGFNTLLLSEKAKTLLWSARLVSLKARKFGTGQWLFNGFGSEKKWYSAENSPQGAWDNIAEEMLLEFAESGCPIFRATTPLSRGNLKSKRHGKLSIHFAADQETIETIFRIILSVNQLSLYGTVANMCEECEAHQDRSGQPDVLMGQSIVLSEIKAEVPLDNDIPSYQNLLLQRYEERIELLSQENKVSIFCMDAGFIHVVENGQYFMTKDTEEQFFAIACREYTLPRSDESSQPQGWIQGNTRIGPVLEITTSYLYGKRGIEIRIWSLSKDNSQSSVRISHRSNQINS